MEAHVVGIQTSQGGDNGSLEDQVAIKVHFKGFTPKWDEVIQVWEGQTFTSRIFEVGALTKAYGWAHFDKQF
jgi:hypothetical protein